MGVFSVGVNAAPLNVPKFEITSWFTVFDSAQLNGSPTYVFTPRNGTLEKQNLVFYDLISNGSEITSRVTYEIKPIDTDILIPASYRVSMFLKRPYVQFGLNVDSPAYTYATNRRALIKYTDGTMEYCDVFDSDGMTITFTPKKDVSSVEYIFSRTDTVQAGRTYHIFATVGEHSVGDTGYEIIINETTEEIEKLDGIIGWLIGIKDGITNVFDSIAQLPAKIWEFISNGLKSLFVPSEEFITDYKDRMDTMLAEKLGAVYECSNVLFESWDRITDSDDTNTIEFPSTTIDVGETDFTFGGYQVEIVPQGFDFLANAVKLIVAILCTIAFVNGMRKRYDEVMGG